MKFAVGKEQSALNKELSSIQELQRRALELAASFRTSENVPKLVDITHEGKNAGRDPVKSLLHQKLIASGLTRECSNIQTAIFDFKCDIPLNYEANYGEIGEIKLPLVKGASKKSGRTIDLQNLDQLKLIHNAILI
jgi:hypothetical protein